MSKIKFIIIIIGVIILFALAAFAYGALSKDYTPKNPNLPPQSSQSSSEVSSDVEENTSEGEAVMAPDFTVYNGEGKAVKLSDFVGKPVVMNFWATWCGYCKQEMPAFEKLAKEYGDEVVFMMINVTDGQSETKEDAVAYITENGYTFPVYYDIDLEATYTYGAYSLPATGFVSAEGEFLGGQMGAMTEETLQSFIEELLLK